VRKLDHAETVETDCPTDVVDRRLWRDAQRILHRHVVRLDGTCHWCERRAPCAPRELAARADALSRLPRREAWGARNGVLMPMINPEMMYGRPRPGADRHQRLF
jgi:hypothetical protein